MMSYLTVLGLFASNPDLELDKIKQLRKELEERSASLKQREKVSGKLDVLRQEEEELRSKISESKQLFKTLQKETSEQLEEYKKFESSLGSKKAEIERIEKVLLKEKSEIDGKKAFLASKERELVKREEDASNKLRSVAVRESNVDRSRQEVEAKALNAEQKVSRLSVVYSSKHKELEKDFSDKEHRINARLNEIRKNFDAEKDGLTAEIRKRSLDMESYLKLKRAGVETELLGKKKKLEAELSELKDSVNQIERDKSERLRVAYSLKNEEKAMAEKIRKNKALLHELEKEQNVISDKAEKLKTQERLLNAKESAFINRETKILEKEKEVEKLSKLRQETAGLVEEKKSMADGLAKLIVQKNKQLSELRQQETALTNLHKEVDKKMDSVKKAEQDVNNNMSKLKTQERILESKEDSILSREKKIESKEREINTLTAMAKETEKLLNARKKEFDNLSDLIETKDRQLKDMQKQENALIKLKNAVDTRLKQADSAEKKLDSERTSFEKESAGIKSRLITEFESRKQILEKESAGIKFRLTTEFESKKQALEKDIASREKDLTIKERQWVDNNERLNKAKDALAEEKARVDEVLNSGKNELALVKEEWNAKELLLSQQVDELRYEKKKLKSVVDKDIDLLKDKEKEVIHAVDALERDKDRLENDERGAVSKVRELIKQQKLFDFKLDKFKEAEKHLLAREKIASRTMNFIESENKKIAMQKFKISRIKELKTNLPVLEKKYFDLQDEVKKLTVEALSKARRLSKVGKVRKFEGELSDKERAIHREYDMLEAQKHDLEKLRDMKQEAFRGYLEKEIASIEEGPYSSQVSRPEVHMKISEARDLLSNGRIDDAIRRVAEIEVWMKRVKLLPEEKKNIDYDLKDLKTSIKLASL